MSGVINKIDRDCVRKEKWGSHCKISDKSFC